MPTVLAVDDSKEILILRAAVLSAAGHTVIVCDSGRKALVQLERNNIDLIVTDFNMPGLDGLCMAKQARSHGFLGPIVMSTASDNFCRLGRHWVDQVVPKAAPAELLLSVIQNYASQRSANPRWRASDKGRRSCTGE